MNQSSASFSTEQLQASAEEAPRIAAAAGAAAEALVTEWVKLANAAAVNAVAEHGEGAARKAARRGLSVLKARGVAIPKSTRTATLQDAAVTAAEPVAWLLPPDVSGNEAVVLARPEASGRLRTSFVFFRDGQRVLRVQNAVLALSKIKQHMAQSLGSTSYSPVVVPWGWAQHRVLTLKRWHAEHGVPEPLGLAGVSELLGDAPSEPPPHPFDQQGLALSDEEATARAKTSSELHRFPEFRSWLPTPNALEELLVKLGERLGNTPTPDKAALDEMVRQEVVAATDRYFTPERRTRIVERLKDCGFSVLTRLGREEGLQVAAVIRAVEQAGLITNPPSEIGFLRAFFDKGLAFMASRQGGQLRVPVPQGQFVPEAPSDGGSTPAESAPSPLADPAARAEASQGEPHEQSPA